MYSTRVLICLFQYYSNIDILYGFFSLSTFVFDLSMDIAVAANYYEHRMEGDNLWFFGLSVTFIILPLITTTCFSFRW